MTRRAAIRVAVVDDSAVARRFIIGRLERDPELEVVGAASSGADALALVDADPPHVLVLDEEMPGMSGRDVLRVLRKAHPEVAVVMFSARVGQGTMARFEALYLGADDAVAKPRSTGGPITDTHPTWTELLTKVKRAARSHERGGVHVDVARAATVAARDAGTTAATTVDADAAARAARPAGAAADALPASPAARQPRREPAPAPAPRSSRTATARAPRPAPAASPVVPRQAVVQPAGPRPRPSTPAGAGPGCVVIASSTGGPDALGVLFGGLPASFPLPLLVVQHMPPDFTRLLANRLDGKTPLHVAEAGGGEPITPGTALVAPGDRHLEVDARAAARTTRLTQGAPENSCRPAADVLFRSAVAAYGGRLVAVVLSGMGQDGMRGCEAVRAAGGQVIAQDEATSVVWGMPGAVVQAGLADVVLPIEAIAAALTERARPGSARALATARGRS